MGMDAGSRSGRRGVNAPQMNVTPLVDVVLVLLIIFMVITPLLSKQFWINLPEQEEGHTPPSPRPDTDGPLVVSVDTAGAVRINHEVLARADLGRRLRRALAARGERTIFFDADEEADYATAVEVLDLARGGGASTIAILTRPLGAR